MKYHGAEIAIGALAINSLWATVLFVMNMTEGVLAKETFEIARIGQTSSSSWDGSSTGCRS